MKKWSLFLGLGLAALPVPTFAVALTLKVGSALGSSLAKESAFPLTGESGVMGGLDFFTSNEAILHLEQRARPVVQIGVSWKLGHLGPIQFTSGFQVERQSQQSTIWVQRNLIYRPSGGVYKVLDYRTDFLLPGITFDSSTVRGMWVVEPEYHHGRVSIRGVAVAGISRVHYGDYNVFAIDSYLDGYGSTTYTVTDRIRSADSVFWRCGVGVGIQLSRRVSVLVDWSLTGNEQMKLFTGMSVFIPQGPHTFYEERALKIDDVRTQIVSLGVKCDF